MVWVIKLRRLRWAGHVARMWRKAVRIRFWFLQPEERRLPGRPKLRWEDNIEMDLREVGWGVWTGSM